MYYYSNIRLILIYRPSEGGRLSRPRHCSKCAARAQSCVSQWFSWKHKLLSTARFEPGPSRAAGKRVTTRPLRPALDHCDLQRLCCCRAAIITLNNSSDMRWVCSVASRLCDDVSGAICSWQCIYDWQFTSMPLPSGVFQHCYTRTNWYSTCVVTL